MTFDLQEQQRRKLSIIKWHDVINKRLVKYCMCVKTSAQQAISLITK